MLARAVRLVRRASRVAAHSAGLSTPGVTYVTDSFQWALHEVGLALQEGGRAAGIPYAITDDGRARYRQVVHYGSQFFLNARGYLLKHSSSRLIFSWFHGEPDDPDPGIRQAFERLDEAKAHVDRVVTSSGPGLANLRGAGWPADRITLIPLGVDLSRFPRATPEARAERRRALEIPADAYCVGSFQKDGVGWGEGLEPKLIKGPDVFVDAMELVFRERSNLFVLLTGPARGWVKRELARRSIPFRHVYLDGEHEVARAYDAVDCCLIASRSEGGPKALMESMAKGVPVVSTRMGMPADVLADGRAGLLAAVGDAEGLAKQVLRLAAEPDLAARIVSAAGERVRELHWPLLAKRYVDEVYRPLLAGL